MNALDTLFDKYDHEPGFRSRTASTYEFLCKSDCQYAREAREFLLSGLKDYPDAEARELVGRLSSEDVQFNSAFWEIYLYQLFASIGYEIQVHPEVSNGKNPDFYLSHPSGQNLYLEALTSGVKKELDTASNKIIGEALDYIDANVKSNLFRISIGNIGYPTNPVSKKEIANKISKWLEGLDHPECLESENSPSLKIDTGKNWKLEVEAKALQEPSPDGSIIYGNGGFTQWIDTKTGIKDRISEKAGKYGELNEPYVIAVNSTGHGLRRDDVFQVLFGEEEFYINPTSGEWSQGINPNGLFLSNRQESHTRVSGVLIGYNIRPFTVKEDDVELYLHPYTQYPIQDGSLRTLPINKLDNEGYPQNIDGIRTSSLF